MTAPAVLVIAGLDPSGGAGLAADLEALAAVGARGCPVAAALTAQGPRALASWLPVPAWFVREQIEALLGGREIPRSAKTGMIGTAAVARAIATALGRGALRHIPLVVDPVLAASSGAALLRGRAAPARALAPLLARAALVTPNLPELEALTGRPAPDEESAVAAARALGCRAVLVKGGHRGGEPVDLLVRGSRVTRFPGRRRPGTARGTGCRLASAIAGLLARGESLEAAVGGGKRVVEAYLDRAALPDGRGRKAPHRVAR